MHLNERQLVRVLLAALRWHLHVPLTMDDILPQMNMVASLFGTRDTSFRD